MLIKQGKGTPQGGVISPLLANLYLHYAIDKWLCIEYPAISYVRYADDIIIHCQSEQEARTILESVKARLKACCLEVQEKKTKIVYCQDYRRKKKDFAKRFDFLGFSFQPKSIQSNRGGLFLGYTCNMSISSRQRINEQIKQTRFHKWSGAEIEDIAKLLNPKIRGWVNYYGKFSKKGLAKVFRLFHERLVKWVLNKYKSFKMRIRKAYKYLNDLRESNPSLFYHWKKGYGI